MDILTAIETRASSPRLGEPAPSRADLERILLAGAKAPDHGRIAPWRFVVLEGDRRHVLGEAMAALLKRTSPDKSDADLQSERTKALRAPTIVVAAAHADKTHKVPEIEQILAVAAAVQNMFLAANALGYGAMWKTGSAAYDASVKSALGLEASDQIVAFLYLGTPPAKAPPRPVTLEGLVRYL